MTTTAKHQVVTVPRLWPDSTIAILASGPSMTQADADYVRARADAVIVINETYKLAPKADVLYASDGHRWWQWRNGVPEFTGLKYSAHYNSWSVGVPALRATGDSGLDMNPTGIRTGKNSAYAAINVAVHLGAKRILLLGVDMKHAKNRQRHWHPDDANWPGPAIPLCLSLFPTLIAPLQAAGVSVINCSRDTALTCFPRQTLEEALP